MGLLLMTPHIREAEAPSRTRPHLIDIDSIIKDRNSPLILLMTDNHHCLSLSNLSQVLTRTLCMAAATGQVRLA